MRKARPQPATRLLVWMWNIVAALVIIYGGVWAIRKFGKKPVQPQAQEPVALPAPLPVKPPPKKTIKEEPPPPAFKIDPKEEDRDDAIPPPPDMEEVNIEIDSAIPRLNACVLAREIARLRGERSREREVDERARAFESKIEAFSGTKPINYLRRSDKILGIDDLDLRNPEARQAGERLARLYQSIYPGQMMMATVDREGSRESVVLYFREAPRSYAGDASIAGAAKEPTGVGSATVALKLDDRRRILELSDYYREGVLDYDERVRLRRILSQGGGTSDDMDFVTKRVLGELAGLAEEEKGDLEEFENALIKEVRARPIPQFEEKLGQAARQVDALYDLATWCRSKQGRPHEQLCCVRILKVDPGFSLARLGLGYVRDARTGWRPPESLPKRKKDAVAYIEFEGKRYTAGGLRATLQEMGYAEIAGRWHRVEKWEFVVDSVYGASRLSVNSMGMSLQDALEQKSTSIGHVQPGHGAPPPPITQNANLRFYAPTGAEGTMIITVKAPAPLSECWLTAQAMVTDAKGTIEVLAGSPKPVRVYLLESGSTSTAYDISKAVRGQDKIVITVKVKMTPDRTMQHARFLPSSPESKGVFVLRGTIVGKAEPKLDALFR